MPLVPRPDSGDDKVFSFEVLKYQLDPEIWLSQEKNPANAQYDTLSDGTLNVSSVVGANAIVAKPGYQGLDLTKFSVPEITGRTPVFGEKDS